MNCVANAPLADGPDRLLQPVGVVERSRADFRVEKLTLTLLKLLRVFTDVILLVIGCRGFTSTTDFQEVIVNACALGFILELTKVLCAVVLDRLQRETNGLMFISSSSPRWVRTV